MSTPSSPSPRSHWPLAFTVMFLAALVAGIIVLKDFKSLSVDTVDAAGTVVSNIVERVVHPTVTLQTFITASLGTVRQRGQLVVLKVQVPVLIQKESAKRYGDFLPAGTTRVTMSATNNLVQFVVPLEELSAEDYAYDGPGHPLIVRVPHPRIDTELVQLDPEPEVRTEVGLLRLDRRSGAALRNAAKAELRAAVLHEGQSQYYLSLARDSAREELVGLLLPTLRQVASNVSVQVEFKPGVITKTSGETSP